MAAKTLMIQGTASAVGKSILVTALCRIFKQDGLRVAPFKSQNMTRNIFMTKKGEEMGLAQAVQAEAGGLEPSVDMNPILLKPEANSRCQVLVRGKPAVTLTAGEYGRFTQKLLQVVEEVLARLRSAHDIVVIEGAGNPAEINLKENEIVNMRIAKLAEAPVLLVGDIDKGGVFASLIGTLALLDEAEKNYIKGFVINKFRGDIALLKPGLDFLAEYTSRPVIGVIPYYHNIPIPEEDSAGGGEEFSLPPKQPLASRQQYDELADIVRHSLNLELVYKICGL
ncbi:Cobyric acid synthase [subsurface metagenome]